MRMRNRLAKVLSVASVAFVIVAALAALVPTARAEPYDTGYGVASLSVGRAYVGTAFGDDGLLYVFGGNDGIVFNTLDSVLIYDVSTGSTTYGTHMPIGVRSPGCVKGDDGRIYVMGGYNTSLVYPLAAQIYDPASDSWTTGSPLPRGMFWTTAAVGHDGRIFLFGGYDYGDPLASTLIYDPVGDDWAYGVDLPTPRWDASAVTLANGSIAVMGGSDGGTLDTVEIYNPTDDLWSAAESLQNAKRGGGAALGSNGLLYSFGGTPEPYLWGSPVYSLIERSEAGSWAFSDYSLWNAREGFGTAVDKFGRVFAVGGFDGANVVSYVEYLILSEITDRLDLAITTPADGKIVSGVVPVGVILKNGASVWSSPVATIDFLVDDVWQETQMGANSWAFLWDTTGLPDLSTHTLTVRAYFWDSTVKEDSVTVTVSDLSVEESVAAIEQQLADLQSQLTSQDANMTALRAQVTALQAQVTGLQAGLLAMGAGQTAAMNALNATLADLQLQLDEFQEQIDRVETKADNGGTYGMVTLALVIVVIVLLALMFMMSRKKP